MGVWVEVVHHDRKITHTYAHDRWIDCFFGIASHRHAGWTRRPASGLRDRLGSLYGGISARRTLAFFARQERSRPVGPPSSISIAGEVVASGKLLRAQMHALSIKLEYATEIKAALHTACQLNCLRNRGRVVHWRLGRRPVVRDFGPC